jgi:hypothetical protein
MMDDIKEKIISRDLMEINLGLEGVFTRLTDRRSSEIRSIGWEPSLLWLWFSISQDNRLDLIIKAIPDSLAGGIQAKPFFRWHPNLGSIRFRSRFRSKVGCIGLDGTNRTVNIKGSIEIKRDFIIMIIIIILDVMEEDMMLGLHLFELIIISRCGRKEEGDIFIICQCSTGCFSHMVSSILDLTKFIITIGSVLEHDTFLTI